jgi:hypothetical protein
MPGRGVRLSPKNARRAASSKSGAAKTAHQPRTRKNPHVASISKSEARRWLAETTQEPATARMIKPRLSRKREKLSTALPGTPRI